MSRSASLVFAAALLAGTLPAAAQVRVTFVESAPKDRFVLVNEGACALDGLTAEIDLSTAAGGLIFDVTAEGAGVEVFQPLEMEDGDVSPMAEVRDGDSVLRLSLGPMAPGARASVTIDVDDTQRSGPLGRIRVAGAEIEGGRVVLTSDAGLSVEAAFDAKAQAAVPVSACAA